MNVTEKSLNKQSRSILSDSSISTTTVELRNLELNLEPFSVIAKKLIKAGWDGDEDKLDISGTKKNPQYKYQDFTFPQNDLDNIKSIVLRQLGKTSGDVTSDSVNSLLRNSPSSNLDGSVVTSAQASSDPSIPQNTYENALENLRSYLLGLQNPYLAKNISDKLQDIKSINWYYEETLLKEIIEPRWSFETREHFAIYLRLFRQKALQSGNSINQVVKKMKEDLLQVILELKSLNELSLKEYVGWEDFQRLFEIPAFGMLNNSYYIKIKRAIDQQAPDLLRDTVEELDKLKALDQEAAELRLHEIGYGYDLGTLLGQVIKNRPRKSEGIITHWSQPTEFFVGKTLILKAADRSLLHFGLIARCQKNNNGSIHFYLDDNSKVWVQSETLKTMLTKNLSYYHLVGCMLSGVFSKNDTFTIRHRHEASSNAVIPEGEYTFFKAIQHAVNVVENIFYNPYWNFFIRDEKGVTYCILVELYNDQVINIKVGKRDEQTGNYGPKTHLSLFDFERAHIAEKKSDTIIHEINKTNADSCILVQNELNEDRVRRQHLKQINAELLGLREELQTEKNEPLMEILLENLVANEMKGIEINVLDKNYSEFEKSIKGVSRKYFDALKISRTPENILLELVLDVNYAKHINIEDNILIARTMKLLKEAKVHIDNIENHNLILFMGNTGSGKSTSIAYLMKAPLKKKQNHLGEDVLHIQEDPSKYPKIGHAVGTSETIYTQGYAIPGQSYLLGDCPGFNDTRGGDYELCTNFSIDQAVLKSKNLLSIVIVLPVSAFLLDRGNPIFDLVKSVQERFPFAFNPDHSEKSARVQLLLTKQGQSKAEVVAFMKKDNGGRFEEFVKETKTQIEALIKQGSSLDSFEVKSIQRRQRVWQSILQMSSNGQVHFIDIPDQKEALPLLESYSKPISSLNPPLDKEQYLPAMVGDMHKKFGDSIQMSAKTWVNLILRKYLFDSLEEIKMNKDTLSLREKKLLETREEKANQLKRVEELIQDSENLKRLIRRLEDNVENVTDEDLRKELLAETTASSIALIEQHQNALSAILTILTQKEKALIEVKAEVEKYDQDISAQTKKIGEIQNKIKHLEEGNYDHNLDKWKPDPDQHIKLPYIKEGAREKALQELRQLNKDDVYGEAYSGLAKNYVGTRVGIATIERGYRLVPSDPKQRNEFLSNRAGGEFIAKIVENKCKFDLEPTASADGKKVCYAFSSKWDGTSDVPNWTIDFSIPNREYNYAEINGLNAEIGVMQQQLLSWNLLLNGRNEIVGARQQEKTMTTEISKHQKKKIDHEQQLEDLKNNHVLTQVNEMLAKTKDRFDRVESEKEQLNDFTTIDKRISEMESEIAAFEKEIPKLLKNRRHLAIVIKTQWESAILLREFADHVCTTSSNCNSTGKIYQGEHLNATISTCKEFIELFDQHKDTLLEKIKEEHGF